MDETRSRQGVKCLLYEAKADEKHDFSEIKLKKTLQEINPGMGLGILAPDDSPSWKKNLESAPLVHLAVTS